MSVYRVSCLKSHAALPPCWMTSPAVFPGKDDIMAHLGGLRVGPGGVVFAWHAVGPMLSYLIPSPED